MRKGACVVGFIVMVAAAAMLISACGSSDILDEEGQRYQAVLSVLDNEEAVVQVDTIQDDCDGDAEVFSDTLAEVEIIVASDAPGITLQSYTIQYFPLGTPYAGGIFTPPDLNMPPTGYATFSVPSGGTATLGLFTLVSVSTKFEFDIDMGWLDPNSYTYTYPPAPGEPQEGRYTIRLTLYFEDTYGNDRTITVERTAYLKDYDHC